MCGINGIVEPLRSARAPDELRATLRRMNQAVAHRGPDGEGELIEPGLALGHRRLSIIDLSDAGAQPMFNEDGRLALVFNGEIYNHVELRQELQAAGHVFRSRSDTEVILHAHEQWGDDCVQRFNGMWAFALWDRQARRLLLSRDRLGVKPLCYALRDGRLVFSSEPAGVNAAQRLDQADTGKLFEYLAYGYRRDDGRSFYAGLSELPLGHHAVWQDGQLRLQRHWQLSEPQATADPRAADPAALRELLADAVRLRFRSDVPVALLQSGGLDSSAICAVVNDEIAAGRLQAEQVTAFTAVHPGHPQDETRELRALMATCPRVQSVELTPDATQMAQQLPQFVAAMQEPQASPTSYAHWGLMREIAGRGIKVVLNGQGADEAWAGYGRYIAGYRLLDLLLTRPQSAWREARAMQQRMGFGAGLLASQTAKALLGRRAASAWRARITEGAWAVLDADLIRQHSSQLPEVPVDWRGHNLDRHLRSQLLHYGFGQILRYEDQSSMNQSVEIRSPFIDHRLMALAFAQPMGARFSDGITKRALRKAFAQRLPAAIVDNHRKIGFATPFAAWAASPAFRALLQDLVASDSFRSRRLWNAPLLAQRLLQPDAVAHGFPVWRFVNAELWLRAAGISDV